MPRILAPQTPQGPGQVITLPRPRNVGAAPTGLADFGSALGQAGNFVLRHVVEQERAAARTKLEIEAVQQLGGLEAEVDAAGTASEARALWDERFPKVLKGLQKSASDKGVPEFAGDMELLARRSQISTRNALAKRMAREGVDDFNLLLASYQDRLAGARTQADFVGLRGELQRSAVHVAQTNPLVSPAEAERLYRGTLQQGATRRATAIVEGAVGDVGALQAARASVLDESQHPDLPLEARADLARLSMAMEEQAIDRVWQQSRRAEIMEKENREKHQLASVQSYMERFAADQNVTDQELQLAVARGDLDPSAYNFLTSVRNDEISAAPNVMVYDDHLTQAEYGMLDQAEVSAAMEAGAYSWEQGRSLLSTNVSSRRQGGVMRDAEVQAGRDLIDQVVLGAVGDDPTQQFFAFWNAADTERRMVVRLRAEYDATIQRAVAEGTSPTALQPRAVAGQLLQNAGLGGKRPALPVAPGPFSINVLSGRSPKEIEETIIPMMAEKLALGGLSRDDEVNLEMQILAVRNYMDQLRNSEAADQTIKMLIDGLPKRMGGEP